jgi:glycosyltransferase involved in cell wall biosynthesis
MGQALPEILARGTARQLYRLLRISAPLLRPIYQHVGLENRARAVTALVRIGWNGATITPALVKESEIVAPERLSPGVACIGHHAAESGVGEALRATARALQTVGVPFTLFGLDEYTTARLQDRSMAKHESSRLGSKANLICDGLIGADIAVRALGPAAFAGRTNILRPFWELSTVPPRFAMSLSHFQEIWAPSEFVRAAFAQAVDVPVLRMPVPVELGEIAPVSRAAFGLPEEATLFLFAFDPCSFFVRKNPIAVIRAFHKAFGERGRSDVGLVVKTLDAGPHAGVLKPLKAAIGGDPRIHLIEGTVSRAEMNGLLASADVFVSLHRSEGFGFGLAEAMLLGKPVIGTDYSGNTDFLNHETGYLVPYQLVPVRAGEYPDHQGQVWAEPDIAVAAAHMASIVDDPAAAEARAARGQAFIKTHHSLAVVGKPMRDRLTSLGLLDRRAGA